MRVDDYAVIGRVLGIARRPAADDRCSGALAPTRRCPPANWPETMASGIADVSTTPPRECSPETIRAHLGDCAGVNQMISLGRQRAVHADDMPPPSKSSKVSTRRTPSDLSYPSREIGIVEHDVHPQRFGPQTRRGPMRPSPTMPNTRERKRHTGCACVYIQSPTPLAAVN